jgi:methylase of polypeptide subunit release factors
VHGRLFLHSAFPTDGPDAVFLGPDSYRFADLIARELQRGEPPGAVLEIGAGAGVGGLVAARHAPGASILMTDVNLQALRFAAANAAHAQVPARLGEASGLEGAPAGLDLIVANPPYIAGAAGSVYQDGGDMHGARLSIDWARASLPHLAPGGRLILYTGSAILNGGEDRLRSALAAAVSAGFELSYRELDPDVSREDLARPEYADVERIAAVGAVIRRR